MPVPPFPSHIDPARCRLLVVDDAIAVTHMLAQVLEQEGFTVDTATGGREALTLIGEQAYDLVLLDLRLPDVSGLEVCRQLRDKPGYEQVPVLFLTASRDEQDIVAAFDNGAADYIRKPFNLAELLARVGHHLDLRFTRISLDAAIAELTIRAETDELTGIPNRRHVLEQVEREFARFRRNHCPFSVLTLDLDHFKQINDHYGHAAGDRVLRQVALTLQQQLRQVDGLGRLGGEEFLILLPETESEPALEVAERLRQAIADTRIPWQAHSLSVTISIGVATIQETDTGIDAVLMRSDNALYTAKARGRNCSQQVSQGNPDSEPIAPSGVRLSPVLTPASD